MAFIGLNPSTADETADDPTIRKCIKYAKAWGFGGLLMLNVYSFRATNPDDMWRARDTVQTSSALVETPANTWWSIWRNSKPNVRLPRGAAANRLTVATRFASTSQTLSA